MPLLLGEGTVRDRPLEYVHEIGKMDHAHIRHVPFKYTCEPMSCI